MKFYKSAMLVAAMLLGFSSVASATTYNVGCGDNGAPSLCDNPQQYSETFTVDSFKEGKHNKSYWSFDAISEPTLNISSVTLEISSSSNGYYDDLYIEQNYTAYFLGIFPYEEFGYLKEGAITSGTTIFNLSSNLFDEVIAGLSLKAWFSLDSEEMFWAKLTVNGEYCPPVSEVPVPAAVWLLGSGLMGMTAMRRRKKTA